MRYRITHLTSYTYADATYESFNEVRLNPVSDAAQVCLDFSLNIDPPAAVTVFRDYYGNTVHHFGVPYLHDHLTIEATSEVVTFAAVDQPATGPAEGEPDRSPPLAELAADPALADDQAEFLIPSTYVGLDRASADFTDALLAADPAASAYGFFRRAGAAVHDRLEYRVGVTTVRSTVADVLAGGSGVCQDFAHLLIALCRHAGLPARYVSGYLGDVAGSRASHAWAESFVPPYGWVGLDATIGFPCTGRHVKLAVGRDYADVAVVRGTYRGGGNASLDVEVNGTLLDATPTLVSGHGIGRVGARGELMQFQRIGALKQIQRLGAMTQAMGSMVQTMARPAFDIPPQLEASDAPRQQPQQQQQLGVAVVVAGGFG
jgi:transglutaminase-like putative cysteine protease